MAKVSKDAVFQPLNIAILTVSDSRTIETDTSGQALQDLLTEAGHQLADRKIIPDDIYTMRAVISQWIASKDVQVVLISGGTGFTGRDNTPQAITPLFDKHIEGFGELFRQLSFQEIGTSTIQSRAVGGLANATLIFAMPGSTNACKTAWNGILKFQLDARQRPCNFVALINRFNEDPNLRRCESRESQ
ncbi:MAG: molybdenum cofactor biosynthesis protein B [Kangiellaceae bacterium]|nr:molybdenum cofactor biosynthesis protein B [Kangiellaceae bacterium]|tara:strand:- start:120 stop:686 length:567 start_codon:yes stop_codon:yes gene_type:complete